MKVFLLFVSLFFISCNNNRPSRNDDLKTNTSSIPSSLEKTTLEQDILIASEWLVNYFNKDKITLDYSLKSIQKLDDFFDENSENGNPKNNSKLSDSLGYKLFAISSYIGQVVIKNVPESKWVIDDNDSNGEVNIEVLTKGDGHIWPAQKVMKRYKNGSEDGLYGYAYMVITNYSK